MENNSKPKMSLLHKPTTRRDFIAQGLIAGCGLVAGPSLLGLAMRAISSAQAESPAFIPFITIDCAGGAALPGNFLVGKDENLNTMIASYSRLGWNPRTTALDTRYGIPMAGGNVSRILTGINGAASADAQIGLRMGSLCHPGVDDVPINELSAFQLVTRAGSRGTFITNGVGTKLGPTGGRSTGPDLAAPENALQVTTADSLSQVATGGAFLSSLQHKERINFMAALRDMVGAQVTDAGISGTELGDRLDHAVRRNFDRTVGITEFDPRKHPIFSSVFGISPTTPVDSLNAVQAAVAMAALTGLSGPGVITVDGCDYHDGTSTTGDNKDQEIGTLIGRLVEAAFRMKKRFMFHILTDGGISSDEGERIWRSDAGDKSLSILGVYDPTTAPVMKRLQIGAYTDGQGADRNFYIGQQSRFVAYVTLANYLQATGRPDLLANLPTNILPPGQIEPSLLFA